ncbi:MAG: sialate O-acetylesterase, partial [Bryocella sp.]
QSNMQGHARITTFDYLADDPKTAPLLEEMRTPDGKPRVCDKVWISSVGCAGENELGDIEQKGKLSAGFGATTEKIGPEFTFGITMEKMLGEPILIIKTSWGGRSLHTDFRPPSAGPYVWSDYELNHLKQRGDDLNKLKAEKLKATGLAYRRMIGHVRKVLGEIPRVVPGYDEKQGYELAGFVWFQGFNDLVSSWTYHDRMKSGGYDQYGDLLVHFIRDVRKDLAAPKLPFVIGVIGVGGVREGLKPPQMYFRQAQVAAASFPEFKGNVAIVRTEEFWDEPLAAIQEKRERVEQMRYLLRVKDKKQANKDGNMTAAQQKEYLAKFEAELISPAEAALFQRGASNAGYHYLGCAKTFARMGKSFAEALLALRQPGIEVKP